MNRLKGTIWRKLLSLRGNSVRLLGHLEQIQWLDRERTIALREERLARLLAHAYNHVPYYKGILSKAGVIQNGALRLENFSSVPLLDKTLIRCHHDELKSDDLLKRKWYENTSGGSTGEPVRFVQDKAFYEISGAVKMLDDLWSGYAPGENKIVLWGSERDIFAGREKLKTRLGRRLRGELWFNAFRMTPSQMRRCVEQINISQPVQILAYAESIYELSRFIDQEGLSVHSPGAIMATAGVLQTPMRETIERVFKSRVFNRYGSREVGDIACECSHHKGLHVTMPVQYLEVLRKDGTEATPGETGEIVITNLTNYAMPLIRYRIGDMGTVAAETCTCGRGWSMLQNIVGRTSDTFLTKDGSIIHGEYFTHLFYFKDWIRKFQLIQEDYDRIHIAIALQQVPDSQNASTPDMSEITSKIRFLMGSNCDVSYTFVDDIAPTPSGKFRYTISKIAP
jgi:phenylacetate-CoA ligase